MFHKGAKGGSRMKGLLLQVPNKAGDKGSPAGDHEEREASH